MTEVEPRLKQGKPAKKPRRKKTDTRKLKDEADRLCGQLVRSRGACARCGKTQNLQWAHIIRRNYAATRTDETGAWCLCASCHWLTEKEADEFMLLVEQTIGLEHFYVLKARAKAGVKTSASFWASEVDRLKTALRIEGEEAA